MRFATFTALVFAQIFLRCWLVHTSNNFTLLGPKILVGPAKKKKTSTFCLPISAWVGDDIPKFWLGPIGIPLSLPLGCFLEKPRCFRTPWPLTRRWSVVAQVGPRPCYSACRRSRSFRNKRSFGKRKHVVNRQGVVDFFLVVGHSWGPVAGRQMQFEWQQPKKTSNMSLPSKGSFLPKKTYGCQLLPSDLLINQMEVT